LGLLNAVALFAGCRYQTTYNCETNSILAGYFLNKVPPGTTGAQRAKFQKDYVDLGLMHRVTFSDFLQADPQSLGLDSDSPDWSIDHKHASPC
jgi:hypothetical protein